MAGLQNLVGTGKAQVLQGGQSNPMQIAEVYQQQQARKENQKRYDDAKAEQSKKELYSILGDAFNPKDFNLLLHGKLKDEVSRLAQKINTQGGSYGDIYLEANQKAGELSAISTKLNSAKSLIDESEKEWAGYEGIDPIKIKRIAESNLAKDLQAGNIEDNKFYFDEAMNQYGHKVGLTSGSNVPNFKFQSWEKQTPSKSVVSTNSSGARKSGTWKGEYYPAFYTVEMGSPDDLTPPTVKLNEEESGLNIKGYEKMLNKDAYDRYISNKTEALKLNREIENRFGNINLQSEQAEKLRRAIARENVLKYLPVNPDIASNEKEAPRININVGSGGSGNGGGGRIQGNVLDGMSDNNWGNFKTEGGIVYNKDGTLKTGEIFITGENIPTLVRSALKAGGGIDPNSLSAGVKAKVKDGKIVSISNDYIGTVSREDMEGVYQLALDKEPLKGNKMVFPNSTKPTTPSKSSTYTIKGKNYSEAELLKMGYTVEQIAPYKK